MNHCEMYRDASSRTVIDVAIGVLVGLRRCSERQAFKEIASAVNETGVGLASMCRALIALASGTTDSFDHSSEVINLWGQLLAGRSTRGPPSVQVRRLSGPRTIGLGTNASWPGGDVALPCGVAIRW